MKTPELTKLDSIKGHTDKETGKVGPRVKEKVVRYTDEWEIGHIPLVFKKPARRGIMLTVHFNKNIPSGWKDEVSRVTRDRVTDYLEADDYHAVGDVYVWLYKEVGGFSELYGIAVRYPKKENQLCALHRLEDIWIR